MAVSRARPTRTALRVPGQRKLEHSLLVYRRIWRGTLFGTIVSPVLFLTAMGVALGSLVPTMTTFGGVPYIVFLAPGPDGRPGDADRHAGIVVAAHRRLPVEQDVRGDDRHAAGHRATSSSATSTG